MTFTPKQWGGVQKPSGLCLWLSGFQKIWSELHMTDYVENQMYDPMSLHPIDPGIPKPGDVWGFAVERLHDWFLHWLVGLHGWNDILITPLSRKGIKGKSSKNCLTTKCLLSAAWLVVISFLKTMAVWILFVRLSGILCSKIPYIEWEKNQNMKKFCNLSSLVAE